MNCRMCAKILLVFLALLLLVICVMIFLLMIGSLSVSGFCTVLSRVNQGDTTVLVEIDVGLTDKEIQLIQKCVSTNSDGIVTDLYTSNAASVAAYNSVVRFYNGLTVYNKFKLNNDLTANESKQIPPRITDWNLVLTGEKLDHGDIEDTLKSLNDLINCNGGENF